MLLGTINMSLQVSGLRPLSPQLWNGGAGALPALFGCLGELGSLTQAAYPQAFQALQSLGTQQDSSASPGFSLGPKPTAGRWLEGGRGQQGLL